MNRTNRNYTDNKTKDEILDILCLSCKRSTKHRVTGSLEESDEEYNLSEGWSVDWHEDYQIIKCQGCETVSFRHLTWFIDGRPSDDDGSVERIYPMRSADSLAAKPFRNVPQILRRIYSEVIDCFNNNSPTLCAVGLRAVVEGICAAHGVTDGPVEVLAKGGQKQIVRRSNLEGRIAGLQEKSILTPDGAKTLHDHRFLGNEAVHALGRPSQDELRLAIQIVEHTLDQLYEVPETSAALRRAMAQRRS